MQPIVLSWLQSCCGDNPKMNIQRIALAGRRMWSAARLISTQYLYNDNLQRIKTDLLYSRYVGKLFEGSRLD